MPENQTDTCSCKDLTDLTVLDMDLESKKIIDLLEEVKQRGETHWWLSLKQCKICSQYWLVASEERQNDIYCLLKLDSETVKVILEQDTWPKEFETYEQLLQIGLNTGRKTEFVDPLNDGRSLHYTIEDIAKEHPGIPISRLAELLNLDIMTTITIAKKVAGETGIQIDFNN